MLDGKEEVHAEKQMYSCCQSYLSVIYDFWHVLSDVPLWFWWSDLINQHTAVCLWAFGLRFSPNIIFDLDWLIIAQWAKKLPNNPRHTEWNKPSAKNTLWYPLIFIINTKKQPRGNQIKKINVNTFKWNKISEEILIKAAQGIRLHGPVAQAASDSESELQLEGKTTCEALVFLDELRPRLWM